jgi:hypothetical protein
MWRNEKSRWKRKRNKERKKRGNKINKRNECSVPVLHVTSYVHPHPTHTHTHTHTHTPLYERSHAQWGTTVRLTFQKWARSDVNITEGRSTAGCSLSHEAIWSQLTCRKNSSQGESAGLWMTQAAPPCASAQTHESGYEIWRKSSMHSKHRH